MNALKNLIANSPKSGSIVVVNRQGVAEEHLCSDFFRDVEVLCDQLSAAGLKENDIVGFRSPNCYEWLVWDIACINLGLILHVFPESIRTQLCSELLEKFKLKLIVDFCLDPRHCTPGIIDLRLTYDEILLRDVEENCGIGESHIHSFVYSSGMNGSIKGLKINADSANKIAQQFSQSFELTTNDKAIIFLPLSSFQQRLIVYGCLTVGASIVLTEFSQVFHSIKKYSPTFIVAPPLFYENMLKLYRGVGEQSLTSGFGGKIRFLIAGMAPIQPGVIDSYRENGLDLLEAYGLMEAGMIAWNTPNKYKVGSVGLPINPASIVFNDDGEIAISIEGALTDGYFDLGCGEDKTYVGGFIQSGDIGYLDNEGYLFLRGRKKDIIASQNGLKYHPEIIEAELYKIFDLTWCNVVQLDASAVVVYMKPKIPDHGIVKAQCEEVIAGTVPEFKLERVLFGDIVPTLENGLLTQNLKVNRSAIRKKVIDYISTAGAA